MFFIKICNDKKDFRLYNLFSVKLLIFYFCCGEFSTERKIVGGLTINLNFCKCVRYFLRDCKVSNSALGGGAEGWSTSTL